MTKLKNWAMDVSRELTKESIKVAMKYFKYFFGN